MTSTIASTGFTPAALDAFLEGRNEPDWLRERRAAAAAQFQSLPMPSQKDEEWMRTDIRLLRLDRFGLDRIGGSAGLSAPAGLLSEGVALGGTSVSIDSRPTSATLDPQLAKAGVWFGSIEDALESHGEIVRRHLFQAVNPGYDKFAALHAAAWSGGALLYVPAGVTIEQPLHMLSALGEGGVDFSHTIVVLDEGAKATLLAETAGLAGDAPGLHCGAIELFVGKGAGLRYVNLQNWGKGVWHFAHHQALVDAGGSLQWTIAALGSRLAKVNQHVALVGPDAEAQVNGVMFAEDKQHLSYHTLQHHRAPHCQSDLLYKAALQDHSRTVWRGMIKVDKDAQKTNGYQRNDNLVLSAEARSDSIPGLEIEADDVRCTHGATTGRVDDEQVFYCRTRGLTRKEAVRMIVAGFFQQVFDRITIDSVREALGQAIGQRIREYS